MIFNSNTHIKEGSHAFLGASKYHWVNYSDEKVAESFQSHMQKIKGTELHHFADQAIRLGIKMPRTQATLNMYINDAIGFKMRSEQVLFYSVNCFGTADAISYKKPRNKKKWLLRIHDLKTGKTKPSMKQLMVYTAIFCLEYNIDPNDIDIELRIYWQNDIMIEDPERTEILYIMRRIIEADKIITNLRKEGAH